MHDETANRFEDPYAVHSLVPGADADAEAGRVTWDARHSLWHGAMLATTVVFAPLTFRWDALAVLLVTTGVTLLVGHSVGLHRRLIHGSFRAPLWLDHVMMWLGTLVGMGGPLWMIEAHDTRDWGQRQATCHPYLDNGADFWRDYWWNLHCRLELDHPPTFDPPAKVADDGFYRFLERTWMLQQLPVAAALFWMGGLAWVIWGVAVRVCVSVTGHWLVGRFAHRQGPQSWLVHGAGVQAHDVPWAGIPTMGEAWHNNHHAYPGSARIGLYPGQADFGYVFIRFLERMGLAWDIRTPASLPPRLELRRAPSASRPQDRLKACPVCRMLRPPA